MNHWRDNECVYESNQLRGAVDSENNGFRWSLYRETIHDSQTIETGLEATSSRARAVCDTAFGLRKARWNPTDATCLYVHEHDPRTATYLIAVSNHTLEARMYQDGSPVGRAFVGSVSEMMNWANPWFMQIRAKEIYLRAALGLCGVVPT